VGVTITDDIEGALAERKPQIALYVGGMGARGQNYHNDSMVRAGFPEEARKIQDLYLAGRKEEAIAAVPDAYVDRGVLVGPPDRIREGYRAWAESGVTGITISTQQPEVLELMAELAVKYPAIGPAAALAQAPVS
jgi:alkanesulfonate monooxygenase SsuD/methylene tetrahydromethanopterin reductase-like flavin-dependent oxidoreductase (luciferase family)